MAFSFQPKVVTDGMIFCVDAANTKSYPGSGTNVTNIGLTTSTASLINGVAYNSLQGGSFFFDGSNDYISCGDTNFRISGPSLSFEVVFYFDGLDKTNTPIFTKRNGNPPYNQWSLGISNGNLYTGGTGKVLSTFLRPDESSNAGPPDPKDRGTTYTLPAAGIYHVVVTNSSVSASLFVNGVLQSTVTSSQSQNNFLVSGADMRIGNNNAASYFTGSIYITRLYNRTLSPTEVLQNYNALCGRFGKTTIITDGDALSFVNAANISNETQQSAINTLVTDLKGAGLWSKMKAIYPFVGGTATTHKWNLKDPRDVDAAFRLSFLGGWTHSSTGALPNGTTGYANTFLIPNTTLSLTSGHLSFYSRTNQSAGSIHEIGCSNNSNELPNVNLILRYTGDGAYFQYPDYNQSRTTFTNTNSQGYYVGSRTSSSSNKLFKNGILQNTNTTITSQTSLPTVALTLSAYYNNIIFNSPFVSGYSSKECAFATIGDGLTDTDAANLYIIVQKYQTSLGRAV